MDGLHDAIIRGKRRFEARREYLRLHLGEPCTPEPEDAPPNEPRACWICEPGPCITPKECAR